MLLAVETVSSGRGTTFSRPGSGDLLHLSDVVSLASVIVTSILSGVCLIVSRVLEISPM